MDPQKKIGCKEEENLHEKIKNWTFLRPESKDNQINIERKSAEDTGECSISSKQVVKKIDRKQKEVISIRHSKNIQIGDIYITQDSLYDIDKTDKLPMKMISNSYEELFQVWKKRLMNHCKTDNAYMRSLFWKNNKKDFPIKEYFVDLKVQKSELLGFTTGESVQLKEIFRKDVSHHKVILVTGDPGYGKTTLCQKIAYDWGEDDKNNDYLSRFDFVVVIPLRELKGKSVANAILNKISNSVDDSYSTIKRELRRAKLNFLVILDGFDEILVDDFDESSVIKFIILDSVRISKNMTILVTSRPYAAKEIREYATDRFFLEGFSPEHQKKYIELVIKENMQMKNALLQLVNTDYSQLGKCPLMLHMLCCLPDTKYLEKIKTKTDLYIQIFRLIIKRYRKKKDVKLDLAKGKIFYGENLLTELGELLLDKRPYMPIYDISDNSVVFITSEGLKRKFRIPEEYEFIVSLDILSISFEKNGVVYFEMLHETFTEFLVALYICKERREIFSFSGFQHKVFSPFVFGLFTNEVFPVNFMKNIKQYFILPRGLHELYKEIKDKDNQELFRLNTKLLIPHGTLKDSKEDIHFQFTQIYYFIPNSKQLYEPVRNELIQFHKNYNYSNELKIFLILDSTFSVCASNNSSTDFRDYRDIATMIKNLLNSYDWKKFKFYLFGIYPGPIENEIALDKSDIQVFDKIENPAIISEEIRKELSIKSKEPIVSLQSVERCFYYSVVEQEHKVIQNLIPAEVFKYLNPYIKLHLEHHQV